MKYVVRVRDFYGEGTHAYLLDVPWHVSRKFWPFFGWQVGAGTSGSSYHPATFGSRRKATRALLMLDASRGDLVADLGLEVVEVP